MYDSNNENIEKEEEHPSSSTGQKEAFSAEKVQTAIRKLKNRKFPDTDNIHNGLLKNGGPEMEKGLLKPY